MFTVTIPTTPEQEGLLRDYLQRAAVDRLVPVPVESLEEFAVRHVMHQVAHAVNVTQAQRESLSTLSPADRDEVLALIAAKKQK